MTQAFEVNVEQVRDIAAADIRRPQIDHHKGLTLYSVNSRTASSI